MKIETAKEIPPKMSVINAETLKLMDVMGKLKTGEVLRLSCDLDKKEKVHTIWSRAKTASLKLKPNLYAIATRGKEVYVKRMP